jgi:hypothetical protein
LGIGEGGGKGLAVEAFSPELTSGRYIVYGVAEGEREGKGGAGGSDTGDSEVGAVASGLIPQPMTTPHSKAMIPRRLACFELQKKLSITVHFDILPSLKGLGFSGSSEDCGNRFPSCAL